MKRCPKCLCPVRSDIATHTCQRAYATPRPNAPLDVRELPDFWDRERLEAGKDLSTCAAELRRALLATAADQVDQAIDGVEELFMLRRRVRELGEHLRTKPVFPSALLAEFSDLFTEGA